MRRKVPTTILLTLEHDRPQCSSPRLRHHGELQWEMTQSQWHLLDMEIDPRAPESRILGTLVVDAQARGGTRGAVPVDGHPGQDLVFGPGVTVGPIVELFVDPGEEADGGVGESVAQRLRLRGLFTVVAAAFLLEPGVAARAAPFAGVVGGECVLQVEDGV